MFSKEEQLSNAHSPIEVTPEGRVMLFKEEQLRNASSPIEVTLSGRVMHSRDEQQENAQSPIEVTPEGMVYSFNSYPCGKLTIVVKSLLNNIPSTDV